MRSKVLSVAEALGSETDVRLAFTKATVLLRDIVWFDQALGWILGPYTGVPVGPPFTVDISEETIRLYMQMSSLPRDMGFQAARQANMLFARSTDVVDYSVWTRTELYNAVFRQNMAYYCLGCIVRDGSRFLGAVALYRAQKTGDFTYEDIKAMRLVYPHLFNRFQWHHFLQALDPRGLSQKDLQEPGPGLSAGDDRAREVTTSILKAPWHEGLTERERQIAWLVATGQANLEVANRVGLSPNTVKMHLKNIFGKLRVSSRNQLTAYVISNLDLDG